MTAQYEQTVEEVARANASCGWDQRHEFDSEVEAYDSYLQNAIDTVSDREGLDVADVVELFDKAWTEESDADAAKALRVQIALEAEVVTAVMMMLDNRKAEIVDDLFGHATEDYQREWMRRDPFGFWCHLDLSNRARLVKLARDRYLNR